MDAVVSDTVERVLVCVGPSPGSARLVRAAHALARRLGCQWIAAHVALARPLADADQARVEENLRLAEELGAEVARLAGRSTADTLVAYARARGVTRILVGRPTTPRWRDVLFGSVVDHLLRSPLDVEVHVTVEGEAAPARRSRHGLPVAETGRHVAAAIGLVGLATLLGLLAAPVTSSADVVMVFLLAVLVAAFRLGRRAAVVAAALSVAAYNFFFVPPYHTLAVSEARNLLTFAVLFGVGLFASALADRLRRQEADAVARERRTAALLSLTRATASAPDEAAVARAVVGEAASRIADGAALWLARGSGELGCVAEVGVRPEGEEEAARRALRLGTHGATPLLTALPVGAGEARLGVLVLRGPAPGTSDLGDAWARQTALALARVRNAATAEEATVRARTEELRSALLSTVSHDLRTPLAAITGAASTLLDRDANVPPEARRELLTSVRDEAGRLERLVGNLLEMTRLASGPLPVRREWVPLDEVVGAAFARVEATLTGHPVAADLPPDLPLVELDPVLFEHVFVNLLENAARHTPPATPIRLAARREEAGGVEIVVEDEGPGFPEGDLPRLFEPFVRGAPARAPGSGLGLAICRGIVEAHGGTIRAARREGGGAAVVIHLPHRREPPTVPPEYEEHP